MKCFVNGIDTLSIDLELVEWYIPPLPTLKEYSIEIAEKDGEIDLGSVYGARVIQLVFFITNNTALGYYEKIAAASAMFNPKLGDQIITFDGELEGKRYMARAAATVPISKGSEVRTLAIPLKMHDPFPEALRDTSVIEYNQGLEYDQGYEYSFYSVAITSGSQSFTMDNEGTVRVEPIITITGKFTNLSLSDGVNTFTFTGSNIASDVLEIDCRENKCSVKKNGTNAYASSNGVFFSLQPGTTTFTATSTSPDFGIAFIFRSKYLY